MASVTTVTFQDDLDGKGAAETVQFSLDGAQYEIDLSEKNAAALRKVFQPFMDTGRPVRRVVAAVPDDGDRRSRTVPAGAGVAERSAIRTWASDNGVEVALRGRISQAVRDRYTAAHH